MPAMLILYSGVKIRDLNMPVFFPRFTISLFFTTLQVSMQKQSQALSHHLIFGKVLSNHLTAGTLLQKILILFPDSSSCFLQPLISLLQNFIFFRSKKTILN